MKVGLMSHAMGRRDGDRKEGEAEEHEEQEGEGKNTLIRKTKKGKNKYKTAGGAWGGWQPDKTGRCCGTESLASSDFQDIKIGLATIAELHYELPRKLLSLPPLMKFMKLFLLPFAPRPNPARLSAPFPAYTTRLTHCTHARANPKGPDYEAIIDAPLPLSLSATANAPSIRPPGCPAIKYGTA